MSENLRHCGGIGKCCEIDSEHYGKMWREKMALNFRRKFNAVWKHLPHPLRWAIVATVGTTLSLVGIVFLFIPGPGLPLIVLGVAILATEFAWAEVVFARLKKEGDKFTAQAKKVIKRKKK